MSQSEKQPRSCDSCVRRSAKWYCAADDAFLCQQCDASVHSDNSVSHRRHRLLLRTSSPEGTLPSWLSGFTRKPRTPRPHNKTVSPVVPELETSEGNSEENDKEQRLYRVPIAHSPDDNYNNSDVKPLLTTVQFSHDVSSNNNNSSQCLVGLLPSDMDLAEFAADMESLLGGVFDNSSFSMEEFGLADTNCGLGDDHQLIKEELDSQNFDDRGSQTSEKEDDQCESRNKFGLRLDYEALIAEWSVQGSCSPWMNGERPQFGPDDCWLDCMAMWGGGDQVQGLVDEGREARVSRYREKRRTRLFSKKIRYEVRKLNAEKRPRMKGRFVKRASTTATAGTAFPY